MTQKRKKIAVIGGGMSALSSVYTLTKTTDWRQKYDITIYQMGWRIGGKGASGRNAQIGQRIEEHGLHIWFGFYTNAFNLIKDVYANAPLGNSPIQNFDDAFKPHSYIPIMENIKNQWEIWGLDFPTNDMEPGGDKEFLPLWQYIKMALELLLQHFKEHEAYILTTTRHKTASSKTTTPQKGFLSHLLHTAIHKVKEEIKEEIDEIAFNEGENLLQTIIDEIGEHQHLIYNSRSLPFRHLLLLVDKFWDWIKNKIGNLIYTDTKLRRLFILVDLTLTSIEGLLRANVFEKGLDSLNNIEYRDWLRQNGAADITVNSALITALYDVGFAYENGDISKPSYETGNALRIIIRLGLAYKGAFMWKMQAGMGDTIFTPIHELFGLYPPTETEGGITFKFFHKVKNLGLSADKKQIEKIKVQIQATTIDNKPYNPFVNVKDLPCWPSKPNFEQLVQGKELQEKNINLESFWTPWQGVEEIDLEVGKDFDIVIFGTPIATIPHIASELLATSTQWQNMVKNLHTTQTQAYQLWLDKDLKDLGWTEKSPVMTSFVEPVDTWADMSQVIDKEDFPEGYEPKNIAYYCGVLQDAPVIPPSTDHKFPAQEEARVGIGFANYVKKDIPVLFPNLQKSDGTIDWNVMIDLKNQEGEKRLTSQYWRANIDPNERYTLTNVNSSVYRIKTDQTGFSNLYITGDWTQTNFNYGCIECCVMSGMMTARAISGEYIKIVGENDNL